MTQHEDDGVEQANTMEDEIAAIDATIADLKREGLASSAERARIASRVQAAQFQRDILAHAEQKRQQQARPRRPRRQPPSDASPPRPRLQEPSTEGESARQAPIEYDVEAQPEDYRIEQTPP